MATDSQERLLGMGRSGGDGFVGGGGLSERFCAVTADKRVDLSIDPRNLIEASLTASRADASFRASAGSIPRRQSVQHECKPVGRFIFQPPSGPAFQTAAQRGSILPYRGVFAPAAGRRQSPRRGNLPTFGRLEIGDTADEILRDVPAPPRPDQRSPGTSCARSTQLRFWCVWHRRRYRLNVDHRMHPGLWRSFDDFRDEESPLAAAGHCGGLLR